MVTQARAQSTKSVVSQVGFDQKLGAQLPLELRFHDESGESVRLADFLGRRPIIIAPVYYRCPMLCNQLVSGLARGLKPLSKDAGKDFDVVAFSIDPNDAAPLRNLRKLEALKQYDRQGAAAGWHFLTGAEPSIAALASAIGFRYTYNPKTKLFAHAAGVVIVTPDGRIARYFYGIDFPPRDLEIELDRARTGLVSNPIGRLLLLCYDYDSATGKYTLSILRVLRFAGTATAAALVGFMLVMFRRDWMARRTRVSWGEPAA
jgi:protein SCO1/2